MLDRLYEENHIICDLLRLASLTFVIFLSFISVIAYISSLSPLWLNNIIQGLLVAWQLSGWIPQGQRQSSSPQSKVLWGHARCIHVCAQGLKRRMEKDLWCGYSPPGAFSPCPHPPISSKFFLKKEIPLYGYILLFFFCLTADGWVFGLFACFGYYK